VTGRAGVLDQDAQRAGVGVGGWVGDGELAAGCMLALAGGLARGVEKRGERERGRDERERGTVRVVPGGACRRSPLMSVAAAAVLLARSRARAGRASQRACAWERQAQRPRTRGGGGRGPTSTTTHARSSLRPDRPTRPDPTARESPSLPSSFERREGLAEPLRPRAAPPLPLLTLLIVPLRPPWPSAPALVVHPSVHRRPPSWRRGETSPIASSRPFSPRDPPRPTGRPLGSQTPGKTRGGARGLEGGGGGGISA